MEKQKVFKQQLREKQQEINEILAAYMPDKEGLQKTVKDAMHYSVEAGGKRLRPMLMRETYRLCGGEGHVVEPFMAAMEMIHTYSLVHDDLPAMDNDKLRRGKNTTWVEYGEGMAVLAGDALLNYAFETAFQAFDFCYVNGIPIADRFRMTHSALKVLARAAGIHGMIGGQTADLEAEGRKISGEELVFIYRHKTADLIEASMKIGAILAGADEQRVTDMGRCAYNIGIAFQIQDDVLDVEGEEALLGKPLFSDEKNEKQTYVSMYGLSKAKEKVEELSEEAIRILRECPGNSAFLEELTAYLIHREK